MTVYVGTSGWQYKHWRGTFYPQGVAQSRWLEFFAERFRTVELNNSFYALPKEETFAKWAERTPADFVMAAKMSRYLTHIKRLQEPEEPVERFFSRARALGSKLGPVLVQLPPTLKADVEALDDALAQFPDEVRVAVEFRHPTWWNDEVRSVLEERGAACCLADRRSRPVTELWKTTEEWTFLRFHEGLASPHPCYGRAALKSWVDRLASEWGPDADAYVFFNNDPRACAIRDAIVFARLSSRAGLSPTRVPEMDEVTMGDDESAAWATSS